MFLKLFVNLVQSITHLLLGLDELTFQFGNLRTEDLKHLVLLLQLQGQLIVLHVEVSPLHLRLHQLILEVVGPYHLLSQLELELRCLLRPISSCLRAIRGSFWCA